MASRKDSAVTSGFGRVERIQLTGSSGSSSRLVPTTW